MANEINEELLVKLRHFFSVDEKIKKEMIAMCPPDYTAAISDDEIIKYIDNALDSIDYIFSELRCVTKDIYGVTSTSYEALKKLENETKTGFLTCGTDLSKLKKVYEVCVSNMDIEFLNSVKDNYVGYKMMGRITPPEYLVKTVNEFLHMAHSYVLNSDNLLKKVSVVSEKENIFGYNISLRGYESEVFNNFFESFPDDIDVGYTDMVCINPKKLIMMVRDRGHALTIEITITNDIARVDYFIPKLCNVEMINNLPGINKISKDSIGATGAFEVPVENLNEIIYNFIQKVPTDDDMEILYGR